MKYETFSFVVDEYAQELTGQSHQTLMWLYNNGYLNDEQIEDLLSRMVVVPIRNNPKFGQRLLDRFFGRESTGNSYVFPITLVGEHQPVAVRKKSKPKLEVVKDE